MDFKKILFKTTEIDVEKALPDAIVFCAKDGKIQWVNEKASEIFETSKINLMTSNISDFIENPINLAINAISLNKPFITKCTGKEMYFDTTVKEINEGYVFDFRDTVKETEEDTVCENIDTPVNREKNIFLSKLSNDFKAPLQSIIGFSQAMTDGLGGNMSSQQEKYLNIIRKNSTDLMYFVSKLIELSQTESAIPVPESKKFDALNLINSVVKYNEQLYKGKEIRWDISADEGAKGIISTDDNMLRAILQNLLEVILRTIEMGDITIKLSIPDEDFLKVKNFKGINPFYISISCSSLLFSESDLEGLFDPYRVIDSANRKNLLRAMTLACVKNLVQALRGDFWVESKILKSTSFNMLIPQV